MDVPISRLVGFLVQDMQKFPDHSEEENLVAAIQKSGRPRPTRTDEMKKAFQEVLKLAQTMQSECAPAIERLEIRGEKVSVSSFRELRPLVTPDALSEACRVLLDPKATLKDFEASCKTAAKNMWVAQHWRVENNLISSDKRVLLSRICIILFLFNLRAPARK